MRTKKIVKETAAEVMKAFKAAHKKLQNMEGLTPKEQTKLIAILDSVKNTVDNFDRKKKEQLLSSLKKEQEQLDKHKVAIAKQIEDLQNELG